MTKVIDLGSFVFWRVVVSPPLHEIQNGALRVMSIVAGFETKVQTQGDLLAPVEDAVGHFSRVFELAKPNLAGGDLATS